MRTVLSIRSKWIIKPALDAQNSDMHLEEKMYPEWDKSIYISYV